MSAGAQRCARSVPAPPRVAALLLAAALASGCASDLASPFAAVVVAWDTQAGRYKLAQVRIATLESLRNLRGRSGTVLAGGAAVADPARYVAPGASVAALRAKLFADQPSGVEISFSVVNDLVYAEDYGSLELLTAYANLERARLAFASWGLTALQLAPIYAHTALVDARGLSPLAGGELYYPPLGAFFLPPPSSRSQLPLHFNLGAVAHGLALQAYQQLVWAGAPVDPAFGAPAGDPAALPAQHVAASVQQGLADYLGAAAGNDPTWFDHSLQQQAGARGLDQLRCGTGDMLAALDVPDASVPYDPYPLGTVLAFVLWETASPDDPSALAEVATAVLASLPRFASAQAAGGGKLSLAAALDALVAAAPAARQPALCGSLHDRFAALSVGKGTLASCASVGEVAPAEPCQ